MRPTLQRKLQPEILGKSRILIFSKSLIFVAQGEPPYTLAFGSAAIGPSTQPVDALLRLIDERQEPSLIQPARVSQRTLLGGKGRLKPLPPPLPWKQWLLWTVLVLGVAFLAWMVRRLMRQLGEAGGNK